MAGLVCMMDWADRLCINEALRKDLLGNVLGSIRGNPRHTRLADCKTGDLVRVLDGTVTGLAFVVGKNEEGLPIVAFLSHSIQADQRPYYRALADANCVTFGTDWEVVVEQWTTDLPFDPNNYPGMLSITDSGPAVYFDPIGRQAGQRAVLINLNHGVGFNAIPGVPIARWSIWANKDDLLVTGVEPLFRLSLHTE